MFLKQQLILLLLLCTPCFAAPPPIQLATRYHDDIDINAYWISEKLDGVRAYWDGQQLISKQGNVFAAPNWFIADFPNMPLDGELWIARGQFEKVSSITRKKNANNEWQQVKLMIFDLPNSNAPFEQRIRLMQKLIKDNQSPYLAMIPQFKVPDQAALQQRLTQVISAGGEGLMLHKADAYYQHKRSADLMKLKRYEDAEAVVIAHVAGKGRNTGRMGALLVKMANGLTFKIGSGFSDDQRDTPPPIGSTITYRFTGKTSKGIPRFASFLRVRHLY